VLCDTNFFKFRAINNYIKAFRRKATIIIPINSSNFRYALCSFCGIWYAAFFSLHYKVFICNLRKIS
jgi:hypothetical protein